MQGNWTPVSDSQRCLPFLWPVLRNCHNIVALCQLLMSCWTYVWYFKPLPHEGTIEAPWTMCTTVFAWFMSSWMDYHIWLQVIVVLGGPIALHGLVHFLNTTGPSLTKTVSYMIFFQMFLHMFAWSLLGSCETLKNWPDVASTGWIVVLPGHQWTLGNWNALVVLTRLWSNHPFKVGKSSN